MIKFYSRTFIKQDDVSTVRIFINEEKLTCIYDDKSVDFIFDQVIFSPDKCNIYLDSNKNTNVLSFHWLSDVKEDRIGDYYSRFRYQVNGFSDRKKLLSIFVSENGDFHVIPYKHYEISTNDSIVVDNSFVSNQVDPINSFSEYKALSRRYEAKSHLLGKVNILDSLASLEAQVDLLFDFVINGNANNEFKSIMNDSSTLTVHNKEKLLHTIMKNKQHIRNLQKTYLEEKGKANPYRLGV